MGHYCDDPHRDAMLCESHDAWVTREPDYYDEPEEADDEIEEEVEEEEDVEEGEPTIADWLNFVKCLLIGARTVAETGLSELDNKKNELDKETYQYLRGFYNGKIEAVASLMKQLKMD